jgi:hypothetical protein
MPGLYVPENGIFHSHGRENLLSYKKKAVLNKEWQMGMPVMQKLQ